MRDQDGQPKNKAFNRALRTGREVDELLGLCKGVLADGVVNQLEAEFLAQWLRLNRETSDQWPANILFERVTEMLKDGKLDKEEEGELLGLLMQATGGDASRLNAHSLSTGLPISDPLPDVMISGKTLCLTGKFVLGSREKCRAEIEKRGGQFVETITVELDYLVIGVIGSRDWIHSSFGRKIEKAVEYRAKGHPLGIVAEEHFVKALVPPRAL
jgi:NAD-dependent DNA ligase